jgi:arylsulfatase
MATPFVAHFPEMITPGGINRTTKGHIMDLMATAVDLAGAEYPATFAGRDITPTPGRSLLPAFRGEATVGHDTLFWEHHYNRAVRQGDWKLVANYRVLGGENRNRWELYNLAEDPAELNDLAGTMPDKVASMAALYEQWADEVGVLLPAEVDSLRN